ncbi:hypothetical protein IQ26_07189, partial [Mesorhizobium tianshanense]
MQTHCISDQLEFEGFDAHKVVAGFDGGAIGRSPRMPAPCCFATPTGLSAFSTGWPLASSTTAI